MEKPAYVGFFVASVVLFLNFWGGIFFSLKRSTDVIKI